MLFLKPQIFFRSSNWSCLLQFEEHNPHDNTILSSRVFLVNIQHNQNFDCLTSNYNKKYLTFLEIKMKLNLDKNKA